MPSFPIPVEDSSPFPVENLPLGIFSTANNQNRRAGTAIGDHVIDLALLEQKGAFAHLSDAFGEVFSQPALNAFAALPKAVRSQTREEIARMLGDASSQLFADDELNQAAFYPLTEVQMHLPMSIAEFTDFSCYEEHVGNACRMSGMSTMPQNFYHSPIAYNGRTSSIILSGVDIPRPKGIYKNKNDLPELQSCAKLDYELEMGIFVSKPLPWGKTISADEALAEHVFGYALLNDWSARDIQSYESFPVGPFNAKSFATSLAPWVILPEALEPAKTAPLRQKDGDVLPHLQHKSLEGTIYDVAIECSLARNGKDKKKHSLTNFAHSYFSVGQVLCHRALSGCGLRTGELVAAGTMSSPEEFRPDKALSHCACLWELCKNSEIEVPIVGGKFLEDGDEVTFEAWTVGFNDKRIGFGSVVTKILPSL